MAKPAQRRHSGVWRLLTFAGLVVGTGSLVRMLQQQRETGRGRPRTPPSTEAVTAGYEPKDINVRGTVLILAGMAASTALVVGLVFAMVWRFDVARQPTRSQFVMAQPSRLVPPAPHLQRAPFAELARVRGREQQLLHSYGWTSIDHSTARIPIDRAMALSVGKSLDEGP